MSPSDEARRLVVAVLKEAKAGKQDAAMELRRFMERGGASRPMIAYVLSGLTAPYGSFYEAGPSITRALDYLAHMEERRAA